MCHAPPAFRGVWHFFWGRKEFSENLHLGLTVEWFGDII
jgi:hypothetical protein